MTENLNSDLFIEVGPAPEGHFPVVSVLPRWVMFKASAARTEQQATAVAYETSVALIRKDHRDRFDEYMAEHDEAFDRLLSEIKRVIAVMQNRPREGSSTSSPTPSLPESEQSSRVVSFSRGTAVQEPVATVSVLEPRLTDTGSLTSEWHQAANGS